MMWNSFVSSYRFIVKGRTFTAINLVGLVAGLMVSFFLMIFIINELSMNSSFPENNRIYRILSVTKNYQVPQTPYLLVPLLASEAKGIKAAGRMISLSSSTGLVSVKKGGRYLDEINFVCADRQIPEILSVTFLQQDLSVNLNDSGTVYLSESMVRKYFPDQSPIGKSLEILSAGIPFTLTVRGIYRNLPWNSTIRIDFFTGMDLFYKMSAYFLENPDSVYNLLQDFSVESFVLTKTKDDLQNLSEFLPSFMENHCLQNTNLTFTFQNIRDMYLGSTGVENDFHPRGSKSALISYGSLALFILILAGLNYTILSTARSSLRHKEVGVRKVLGATTRELKGQILSESMLLTFLAFPLSLLVLGIIEPFVNRLYGYSIQLYTWNMLIYLPIFAAITLFIGFLSGSYVAFYLSSLDPVDALKNKIFNGRRFNLSKILIVFQLFITLSLLMCVMVIFFQIRYCLKKDCGIDKRNLLLVPFDPATLSLYPEFKTKLLQEKAIQSVSGAGIMPPSEASASLNINLSSPRNQRIQVENYLVDAGFFKTLGVKILEGRDFDPDLPEDLASGIMLNESAVRALNLTRPVGRDLGQFKVIGVVKDFNTHSFRLRINPSFYQLRPNAAKTMAVRLAPGKEDEAAGAIRKHWNDLAPDAQVNYSTFSSNLKQMYLREQKFGQIVASFSLLAFIITGMGLFGLALLIAERKTKEMAIRKVFGATNSRILFRMLKEFLIYTGISSLLSIPVAWFLMVSWLSDFYYRMPVFWHLLLFAILAVAIFVSSIMALRIWTVLRRNLVNALKYE